MPIGTTVKYGSSYYDRPDAKEQRLTYDPGRIDPFGQTHNPMDTAARILYMTSDRPDEFYRMMLYLLFLHMDKNVIFAEIPYYRRMFSSMPDIMVSTREHFDHMDEEAEKAARAERKFLNWYISPSQISGRAKNILPLEWSDFEEETMESCLEPGAHFPPTDDEAVMAFLKALKNGMDRMLERECIVGADF